MEVRRPELAAEQARIGRQAWEKRPSETLKSYTAFALYRDLGFNRTGKKVADELGIPADTVRAWSATHDWVERVELYEVERDRRRMEAELSEQEAARRGEVIAGRAMMRKGLQRIQGDDEAHIDALDVNDFDAADVAKFIETGVRIQRMGLGMPTDFAKGALHMSFVEVGALVKELVTGLLPLIPPDRHQQAFSVVRSITRSGG
jgi:hypothetical protein